MKAALFREFGEVDKLIYEDVPVPEPTRDEVLVRVKACSVNHLDLWVRKGGPAYKVTLPHITGADVSGVVEAIGEGVDGSRVRPGDKVIVAPGLSCFKCGYCLSGMDNMCDSYSILGAKRKGGYAEYVVVPAVNIIPMPEGISFEEAAAFPLTYLTSWHMLINRGQLSPGEDVLIIGASSGIGTAAVQIAKLTGARVLATAGTAEKCEHARAIGADVVINHSLEDFSEVVKEATHGRGVNVVFEHVGPATWDKSIASLAKKGRLITCGATTGPEVRIDLRFIFSREQSILGSLMGTRSELINITKLVGEKRLKPVVDSTYPLAKAGQAQQRMINREQFGKIILLP
ncbi:MAG: zinc-binding dehydrogenase [Nitrospira sp.]|nr:zinc-binding dehydrogenase [Nitrospira sp.]